MELNILKYRKGQISMEFILLVIVMLLYMQVIIQPLADISVSSVDDVTRLTQVKLASEKLVNIADYISSQSNESKFSTTLIIPRDANISCDDPAGSVTYRIILQEQTDSVNCSALGQNSVCSKSIAFMNPDVGCAGMPEIAGPRSANVAVFRDSTGAVSIATTN